MYPQALDFITIILLYIFIVKFFNNQFTSQRSFSWLIMNGMNCLICLVF